MSSLELSRRLSRMCTYEKIRTSTEWFLKPLPLPLGYTGIFDLNFFEFFDVNVSVCE